MYNIKAEEVGNAARLEHFAGKIIEHFALCGLRYDDKERLIFQQPGADGPMFLPAVLNAGYEYDRIRLTSKEDLWCQTIFQLSHEMGHCFVYIHNANNSLKLPWLEETVCEALSLYFLRYFAENWSVCRPVNARSGYEHVIFDYLTDRIAITVMNYKTVNEIRNICDIRSAEALKDVNDQAERERGYRGKAVIGLYTRMRPASLKGLVACRDYTIPGTLLVDADRYIGDFSNNDCVKYICSLQSAVYGEYKKSH